ncbi:MAG: rhodanese-like domain-containing protein [Thermoplasmataceae archaeon]|jgi:rhodanese-related sulfurtransferase
MELEDERDEVRVIDPVDFAELMEKAGPDKTLVIDVREPWEYDSNSGHVPNSVLIPMMSIPDKLEEFRRHSDKYIGLICHSGERSYYACQYLKENGIRNVYSIEGGMIRWSRSGLDIEFTGE